VNTGNVHAVGKGFFPLDEELQLLPGELTPSGHESLVRLCGWMPFRRAGEIFEDLLGIRVSKIVSQRYTEEAGAAYEQMQNEAVAALEKETPPAPACAEKLQISADGAMVPLLHGVWAEVRTLVVGEVQPAQEVHGEQVVHTRNLSYFSRKVNAETFDRLALVEIHRRGVENAQQVAAVMDGAEWLQGFSDHHCPQAIRILDFAHAAEHLSAIGACLSGENTPETHAWLEKRLHQLKHAGPDELLVEIRSLPKEDLEKPELASNLAYLEKRINQIQYPRFQAQGWPIGSGIVESGNKIVVEARLKGAGMHWADKHVNPMLTLRNILCSDRWKEEWPKIEAGLRKQAATRRKKLHQDHAYAAHLLNWQPFDLPKPVISNRASKISKPNPWRNFKLNRALYRREVTPKL
jgi:hypothetical protein